MNILFLSTEIPFPLDHGHHLRTYYVLKALSEDHNIHFAAFTKHGRETQFQRQLEELCDSVETFELRHRGWRQALLALQNLFSPLPLIAQKYYDRRIAEYMKKLIRAGKVDLVHLDLLHLALYRNICSTLPSVLVNHNVESLRTLRWSQVERNFLLKAFLKYQYQKLRNFEQRVCKEFDCCTVVSDYDREFLLELCGGGNFVTIPNGVDCDYFYVSTEAVILNTLVWTGSMSGAYNRDAVIYFLDEVWPHIQTSIPQAKVTFVGSSAPKMLMRLAFQSPNIESTGYVDDVRPYVAKSAVFIAPLRSGSGTKVKVLNAMAQGKAVITTSIGAEGIEAKPDEEILIAEAPKEFAEKTVWLLKNPERAQKIGLRARQVIEEKYSWKVINKKLRQVYKEFENGGGLENKYSVSSANV